MYNYVKIICNLNYFQIIHFISYTYGVLYYYFIEYLFPYEYFIILYILYYAFEVYTFIINLIKNHNYLVVDDVHYVVDVPKY